MDAKDLGILLTSSEAAPETVKRLQAVLNASVCILGDASHFDFASTSPLGGFGDLRVQNKVRRAWSETPHGALELKKMTLDIQDLEFQGVEFGKSNRFIMIGSDRVLSGKEQLILLAVAAHLQEFEEVQELRNEVQIRSQFLSIASHELKTPLTSIYGVLQLQERMLRLQKNEPSQVQLDRQHSFLKMVIRQVERLNELIDGLLDVSRIQNGRFLVEPSDADVAVLLREVAQSRLSGIATEAGVSLHLDIPETLHAWVDTVRLEEVMSNLIMNAIRFSPEGGVIWIKLVQDADWFRLIVRDQGPSVPTEDRERIFHPFERAQRTGRLGGLGLGLFISREIASLHGGMVQLVESIPGKGNLFEASFPLRNVKKISA